MGMGFGAPAALLKTLKRSRSGPSLNCGHQTEQLNAWRRVHGGLCATANASCPVSLGQIRPQQRRRWIDAVTAGAVRTLPDQ